MNRDLLLTGLLIEIAEVAGVEAALLIAKAKGGGPAYIPAASNLTDDHWLVCAVGRPRAEVIARAIGGMQHDIPRGPTGARAELWYAIQRHLSEGRSGVQTARLLGIHYRTVRRHRNGHSGAVKKDARQPGLFDED